MPQLPLRHTGEVTCSRWLQCLLQPRASLQRACLLHPRPHPTACSPRDTPKPSDAPKPSDTLKPGNPSTEQSSPRPRTHARRPMSSPLTSDSSAPSNGAESSVHPFGTPAARTPTNIKYRYTAAGKHRSSPLKGISSSPDTKLKTRFTTTTTTPKTRPVSRPRTRSDPAALLVRSSSTHHAHRSLRRKTATSLALVQQDVSLFSSSPLSSLPSTRDPSPIDMIASSSNSSLSQVPSTPSKATTNNNNMDMGDVWQVGTPVWILIHQSKVSESNGSTSDRIWWPAQVSGHLFAAAAAAGC